MLYYEGSLFTCEKNVTVPNIVEKFIIRRKSIITFVIRTFIEPFFFVAFIMNDKSKFLIIAIIAFVVAYGLGLVVVRTVDYRLSEISINMPHITLPEISLRLENGTLIKQIGGNSEKKEDPTCIRPVDIEKRNHFNADKYHSDAVRVTKPPVTDTVLDHISANTSSDKVRSKSLPAPYPNDRLPMYTLNNTQLVPTYYRDPKEMTAAQVLKFKTNAKLANMTIKDYENWLLLFKEDPQNLEKFHRDKLRILLKGGRLNVHDLPQGESSVAEEVLSAEVRFNRMYDGHATNVPQPDTAGPQYAYNFDDFDGYPDPQFGSKNLKHLATFDANETLKTEDDAELKPVLSHKAKDKPMDSEV